MSAACHRVAFRGRIHGFSIKQKSLSQAGNLMLNISIDKSDHRIRNFPTVHLHVKSYFILFRFRSSAAIQIKDVV